jgi:hypothetical protein
LSEQRASQAIKAIGSDQLLQAMQQQQPWKQLKALANNVNFKFVLPAELAATVAQNKGKAVGKKPAKDRVPAGLTPPIELDPAKLTVLEGTFPAHQQVMVQLAANQIGPVSSVFILVTIQEAQPFLKAGQVVSKEPQAIVVFHRSDHGLQPMLPTTRLTVPCRCTVVNLSWLKLRLSRLERGGREVCWVQPCLA